MAVGALLIDKKAHNLVIKNDGFAAEKLVELADGILQAARIKFTKTEYISCPGCGRTLYNLQETIARINPELEFQSHDYMSSLHSGSSERFNREYHAAHDEFFAKLSAEAEPSEE